MRLFLLMVSLVCLGKADFARGQSTQLLTPEQLRADLRQMQSTLKRWHPGYAQYKSVDSLDRQLDQISKQLNQPMTDRQFLRVARMAAANIQCLHTVVSPGVSAKAGHPSTVRLFPISVTLTPDQELFDPTNGDTIQLINGRPSKEIADSLRMLYSNDGSNSSFSRWVVNTYFPVLYQARFGGADTFRIRVVGADGEAKSYTLAARERSVTPSPYLVDQPHTVALTSRDMTLYRLTDQPDVVIWQMRSVGGLLNQFRLRRYFRYLRAHAVRHLILDLRGNTGGRVWASTTFLRYTLENPTTLTFERYRNLAEDNPFINSNRQIRFLYMTHLSLRTAVDRTADRVRYTYTIRPKKQRFEGRMTVLTNGGTASAASLIAAYLQEEDRATFIGEETGGSRFVSSGMSVPTAKLGHSGLRLHVPLFQVIHTSRLPNDGRGVRPNFPVEAWRFPKDSIMQKALEQAQ